LKIIFIFHLYLIYICIKEPISLPPLKNEEIKDAIEKLEDVTRMRLLCDEIVPKPMKKNYVIGNILYTYLLI